MPHQQLQGQVGARTHLSQINRTPNLGTDFAGAYAHNLRAVDAQRNNSKSNKLFGVSTSSTASYSIDANSWYPGDEWIGDVARIVMYMYVRYPSQCAPINVATGNATFFAPEYPLKILEIEF